MGPSGPSEHERFIEDSPCIYCIMLREVCISVFPVAEWVTRQVLLEESIPPLCACVVSVLVVAFMLFVWTLCLGGGPFADLAISGSDMDQYSLRSLFCGLLPFLWCFAVTIYCQGLYVPGVIAIPMAIYRYRHLQVPGCTGWAKLRYIFPFVVQGR